MFPSLMLAEDAIAFIAIAGGLALAMVGMITSSIRRTRTEQAREESRRELAAYVAEGSISTDDAAKLLNAGKSWSDRAGC
ncbi:MAG: hypothetical protein AB7K52_11950 [Phycisphaerales bacterium]